MSYAWVLEKKSRSIGVFSAFQLDSNDTLENKVSAVSCSWTFNGFCHSKKDPLNWIALSTKILQGK